jgi:hypothetical protein
LLDDPAESPPCSSKQMGLRNRNRSCPSGSVVLVEDQQQGIDGSKLVFREVSTVEQLVQALSPVSDRKNRTAEVAGQRRTHYAANMRNLVVDHGQHKFPVALPVIFVGIISGTARSQSICLKITRAGAIVNVSRFWQLLRLPCICKLE